MEYYTLNILGLARQLPIMKLPVGISIAGFNPLGDTELMTKVCTDLSAKIAAKNTKFDVVVTTECKGIPFAHQLAQDANVDYVVFRKEPKIYLGNTVSFSGGSITSGKAEFFISKTDAMKLMDRNVLFVDDVFSTGRTFFGVSQFLTTLGAKVTGIAVALTEGEDHKEHNGVPIFASGFIPLL